LLQALNARRILGWDVRPEERRPMRGDDTCGIKDVFNADRHTVQGAPIPMLRYLTIGLLGGGTRMIMHHSDEGVENRIQTIDASQVSLDHFDH
jgi:hypothetical protein